MLGTKQQSVTALGVRTVLGFEWDAKKYIKKLLDSARTKMKPDLI